MLFELCCVAGFVAFAVFLAGLGRAFRCTREKHMAAITGIGSVNMHVPANMFLWPGCSNRSRAECGL